MEDTHFLSHTISISDGLKQASSATHFGTQKTARERDSHWVILLETRKNSIRSAE
jgi:hypothetical protein